MSGAGGGAPFPAGGGPPPGDPSSLDGLEARAVRLERVAQRLESQLARGGGAVA